MGPLLCTMMPALPGVTADTGAGGRVPSASEGRGVRGDDSAGFEAALLAASTAGLFPAIPVVVPSAPPRGTEAGVAMEPSSAGPVHETEPNSAAAPAKAAGDPRPEARPIPSVAMVRAEGRFPGSAEAGVAVAQLRIRPDAAISAPAEPTPMAPVDVRAPADQVVAPTPGDTPAKVTGTAEVPVAGTSAGDPRFSTVETTRIARPDGTALDRATSDPSGRSAFPTRTDPAPTVDGGAGGPSIPGHTGMSTSDAAASRGTTRDLSSAEPGASARASLPAANTAAAAVSGPVRKPGAPGLPVMVAPAPRDPAIATEETVPLLQSVAARDAALELTVSEPRDATPKLLVRAARETAPASGPLGVQDATPKLLGRTAREAAPAPQAINAQEAVAAPGGSTVHGAGPERRMRETRDTASAPQATDVQDKMPSRQAHTARDAALDLQGRAVQGAGPERQGRAVGGAASELRAHSAQDKGPAPQVRPVRNAVAASGVPTAQEAAPALLPPRAQDPVAAPGGPTAQDAAPEPQLRTMRDRAPAPQTRTSQAAPPEPMVPAAQDAVPVLRALTTQDATPRFPSPTTMGDGSALKEFARLEGVLSLPIAAPTESDAAPRTAAPAREATAAEPRLRDNDWSARPATHSDPAAISSKSTSIAQSVAGASTSPTASAQSERAVTLPQSVTTAELASAVPRAIKLALSEGAREARIRLRPPELGEISIWLRIDGHEVAARIDTERSELRGLLASTRSELAQGLEQAGMKLTHLDIGATRTSEAWPAADAPAAVGTSNGDGFAGLADRAGTGGASGGPGSPAPSTDGGSDHRGGQAAGDRPGTGRGGSGPGSNSRREPADAGFARRGARGRVAIDAWA